MKNIGTGLRTDVSTVEFDILGAIPKCVHPGLVDVEWRFEEHQLPNGHAAAVAWYKPGGLNASFTSVSSLSQKLMFLSLICYN